MLKKSEDTNSQSVLHTTVYEGCLISLLPKVE